MMPGIYRNLAASLLLAAAGAVRLAAAEGDAELAKLAEEILPWDLDGNRQLSTAELAAAGNRNHYPEVLATRFFNTIWRIGDLDGNGRLSAAEITVAMTSEKRQAMQRRKAAFHDQDGLPMRMEAVRNRNLLDYYQSHANSTDVDDILRRFFDVQPPTMMAIPDSLGKGADRDGNGFLDPAEAVVAGILCRQQFDADADGNLSPGEQLSCSEDAYFQDGLFRLCPEVNQDNDCWLSAAEMTQALAKVMPVYDLDKNGRLDSVERALVIRDGPMVWPRELMINQLVRDLGPLEIPQAGLLPNQRAEKIMAAAAAKYGAAGATRFGLPEIFAWRRQMENAQILAKQEMVVGWLRYQLDAQMNPVWSGESRGALWRQRFALYDANHDGKLDALEGCRFYRGEFIPAAAMPNDPSSSSNGICGWYAAASRLLGNGPQANLPPEERQGLLPLLFIMADVDKNGIFSPADFQALTQPLEEKRREKVARQVIGSLVNANRSGQDLTPDELAAEQNQLRQRFDLDHDGKFNSDELRALLAESAARTRDRVLSAWMAVFGRFADAAGDGQLNAREKLLATAMMGFCYDRNESGAFEETEIFLMQSDLQEQDPIDRRLQKANPAVPAVPNGA